MDKTANSKEVPDCSATHKGKITGFCNKCEVCTCDFCAAAKHFDHTEALAPYDLQLTQSMSAYAKTRSFTTKLIKKYENHVAGTDIAAVVKDVERDIRASYSAFRENLKNHLRNYIAMVVQNGKVAQKLLARRRAITSHRQEALHVIHKELNADLSTLMDAICAGAYLSQLPKVQTIEEKRGRLTLWERAQKNDIRNFEASVHDLETAAVEKNANSPELYRIRSLDGIEAGVYKICRDTGSLVRYSISSEKLISLVFPGFTPPYNSSILDAGGCVWLLGGSMVEGTPTDEKQYADQVVELDTYLRRHFFRGKLLVKRMCFGAGIAAVDGKTFIVSTGGYNHTALISSCELFCLETGQSRPLPPLPEKKSNCGLCVVTGTTRTSCYCVGGYSAKEGECACIDVLDLTLALHDEKAGWLSLIRSDKGEWPGSQNPGVVALDQNELLIFGGRMKGESVTDAVIFSPEQGKFMSVGAMNDSDTFLTCRPVVFRGKVYTFGCHENHLHVYDIKEKSWTIRTNLIVTSTPRRSK